MPILFEQLVSALTHAVVEAQHRVQQTHLGELSRFFEEGRPVSVNLKIPRVSPETGRQEPVEISVPLMSLVTPSQLSIKEMQVTMQVDMTEISQVLESEKKPVEPIEKKSEQHYEWRKPEYQPLVTASATTGRKPGEVGMAQVTLRITAEETPEGLARLLDHLNKCL